MMKPKVSIIIPVYNAAEYLDECVCSVINQTVKEIEIILIDDGSKDESGKICDKYAKSDKRIIVYHQENSGVSVARNKGIELAHADWIMFLDSDDWLELDAIQKCLGKGTKEVDLIALTFAEQPHFNCKEEPIKEYIYDLSDYRYDFIGRCRFNNIEYSPQVMHCNLRFTSQCAKLYSRRVLIENNVRFPVGVKDNEDGFYNIEYLIHINKILFINSPIYHVRVHEDSASRRLDDRPQRIVNSLIKYDELIKNKNFPKKIEYYQNIDAVLKSFLILFTYNQMYLNRTISFQRCRKEFAETLRCRVCEQGIKRTKVREIYGIVNQALLICLKLHFYISAFAATTIYYKVKKKIKRSNKQ